IPEREKLTTVQTYPIPYLGDICPRISSTSAIQTEPGLLIIPPCIPVFFENPQRHFAETSASKLAEHMLHEPAPIALAAHLRQHMERCDVTNAPRVIIGVVGWNHLTEPDRVARFFQE